MHGTSDIELSHFGVKGMRWGVRKERDTGQDVFGSDLRPQGVTARRDGSIDIEHAPYIQQRVRETMTDKGYSALRDENDVSDVRAKIAKAPIIVFSPEKSLKVVGMKPVTDDLRKANKQQLKHYKKRGKDWIEDQLYS